MMTLLLAFIGVAKADVVTIGDGTGTTYYGPYNSLWGYSYVEQVYTASEIGTAGTINAISFNMSSTDSQTNAVDVFMKNVSRTNFSGNTDWEPVTASDMVFSGTVTFNNGWTTITLDTPFQYDGTSNLMIGMHEYTSGYSTRYFYYTSVTGGLISGHSDTADPNPYDMDSFSGTKYVQNYRNNIQIDITPGGGAGNQLHVKYMDGEDEIIDRLNMGVRPVGAWMEPFNFTMYTEGATYTVTVLDFTPSDGLFSVEGEELPFQVRNNNDVDLVMSTNGTQAGVIERQFVAITEGNRAAYVWPLVVELYQPVTPDVWELACQQATTFPFVEWPATAHNTTLHNDYTLPFPEIPEGNDAVYKLVFDNDVMLDAAVTTGANGKVALYTEDFYGEGGPMADNYYVGPTVGGGASGGSFEAMIGDETSTTTSTYFPFHTLWNYSIGENLFLASELNEAGVTTAPMTSLSWYVSSTTCTTAQNGISIWMANVSDSELTATSHTTAGMTLVYTGTNVLPVAGEWNEFVFNAGNFAWDGHSNVLVVCQRLNGDWQGSVSWQTHNPGFTAMTYDYDDYEVYDMTSQTYSMYTSATNRANIIFKGGNRAMANRVKRGNRETATVNPHFVTRSGEMNRSGMTNWRNAFRGSTAYGICVYNDGILDLGINQFDIDNMAAANVINSYNDIGGMVYNPNTGHFYVSSYTNSELYEVDTDGTILNTVTTDYAIVSLAWDPTTNTLYSMDGYTWLNIVDPATGSMTDIDALSNTDVMCITANASGQLYGVLYGDTSALVTIDKTDATVTTICTLNAGCNYAQSMAFDMNDNKLYWAQCYDDANLYEINPVSGALTLKVANTSEICGLCIPAASSPTPGPTPAGEMAYGPVIEDAAVEAGTYYLVASSTDDDFEVTINAEPMPCPAVEGFAFGETPADDANEVEPGSVTLRWNVPAYATGWRLIFGTTYHPEANHPQTIIYPEDGSFATTLANSYTVRNLWNNTNYFWRVEFNNGACPNGVSSPVWGFTTHLNIPQNLTAVDYTVFDDETIVLNWNPVVDRTYRQYNVYRDGVLIGNTQVNNIGNSTYTDGPLAYNMGGYTYYVTAVYDEGESAPSDPVTVKVSGYGNVDGHVYEQDGTTGIAGATVTMIGLDEFNVSHTYNFQTNGQGYYSGHIYAGSYNGSAACNGYQTITEPVQGNPIAINYNQETSPIDYMLDENFDPVCAVIAQYYPDSTDINAPYVKVYWGCGLPGSEIIEPFETGDFSLFDWQLDPTYPWVITTQNPYEGNYCMKSGNQQVLSSTSTMQVTVNIPADGEMSFFGKISSEQGWDYGYFYIDGQQMGAYTGESNWGERKFPITAGDHTFKWEYTEDFIISSGDDCFYVDYITFYRQPEPLGAGWHTFLEGEFNDALRSNLTDNPSFGYHYPTSITSQFNGFNLTKVSMFSDDLYGAVGGSYTVNIYQGGAAPGEGTLVSSQPVDLPVGLGQWVDWDLNTPVSVNGGQDLWVIYYVNQAGGMGYPAGMCNSDSNPNGDWWNGGNGWENYGGGVWTMRNYFTNRAGRTVVLGSDAEIAVAAVQGPKIDPSLRKFVKGDNTVTAESINPNAPSKPLVMAESNRAFSHYRVYRTNCYNDGPYTEENTVVLACELHDTIYIDVSWPDAAPGVYKWGVGCVYVGNRGEEIESEITWSEPININNSRATLDFNFDDNTMQGWTNIDADGDGNVWVSSSNPGIYHNSGVNLSGTGHNASEAYVISGSYANQTYQALYPDNYLVSPQIALGGSITFYACAQDATYAAEHFGVAVSTTSNTNASAFTTLQEWTLTAKGGDGGVRSIGRDGSNRAQGNWYQYTVDLSAYSGMGYVAIRHFNCSDQFILNVDDITIVEGAGGPNPPTPGNGGNVQEPRESEIVWSNCLDKDMYLDHVTVNVLLNSADSPEGTTVNFTNLNEGEQANYPVAELTLDESGFYAFETFRRGDYVVKVDHIGYETIVDTVSIWQNTDLRYVMIEIIYGVENVYVSRTGWAMWDPLDPQQGGSGINPGPNPGPGGNGDTFEFGFENGFEGWTLIDNDGDGLNWVNSVNSVSASGYDYTGLAHGGNYFVYSQSFIDYDGAYDADNYLVSPQKYAITNGSTLNFWADNANDSYPDHFAIAISTADTPTAASFTDIWSHQGAKAEGKAATRHAEGRYENWRSHSVDLSAYAGQNVWIAFHHQDYDMYEIWIDDVTLTAGAKSNDRHLEYYKVMCTSIDGVPIFNHNTVWPFCQLSTNEPYNAPLVEGEHYLCKIAVMYSTGMSAWSEPVEWVYEPCDHWGPVDVVDVNTTGQGNLITWEFEHGFNPYGGDTPGPQPGQGDAFSVDFEAGLPAGWTVIDGNNDGWTWCLTSAIPNTWTYYAGMALDWYHNGTNAICSGSYINGVGALTPDEYLVSPLVTIANGSQFSFWAAATDESYAADHFGVFVSDNGTSNWTMVNEWTLTAKGGAKAGDLRASRDGNGNRLGNWYNFSVDLSAYAGQKYIAIRHFNCNDQYIMCVDDVELTSGAKAYSTMESGMMGSVYAVNITEIENFDERVIFLHNLAKDARFDVINGEAAGMFIVSAAQGYEDLDLELAVKEFTTENANQFSMMDKVQAADVARAYKSEMPAEFTNSLMMDIYAKSRENALCADAYPFCTDEGMYEFPAGVNAGSGEPGPDYDCLITTPNPAWYYMKMADPGDMDIYMYSTPSVDIDFCCWGPFADPISPCPNGLTSDKVVSCSYSAQPTEHCMIPASAQTGEYYILVITNYSNQTCNINFSKVAGSGSTDCTIIPPAIVDVIGFLITQDGEFLAFAGPNDREYTDLGEYGNHVYCVRPIYPGEMTLPDHNYGWSMGCPVCYGDGDACAAGAPIYAEELTATDQVKVWWGDQNPGPGPGGCEGDEFSVNFESGIPAGWTTIDADGDGYNWNLASTTMGTGYGHNNSSDMIFSQSYDNNVGVLYPDNYLVTPALTLCEGSEFTFWACAQDAGYAAEHFGVAISENGVNFDMVQEWTMTAKGEGKASSANRSGRAQGSWYQYTVDLSAYAGEGRYIAIRHFNCSDMFYLDVDDIELNNGAKNRAGLVKYNVYRSTDNANYTMIGEVAAVAGQTYYEYIDTPANAGTYYYQVRADYGDCESEPAVSGENPSQNYVVAGVTGLNENDSNVALFPNPTNGNVTIQATGMSRITVVSVLGQVVYDTELNADEFTLNMAQFNAGMYMVRVYTEDGMTVKRVTVMR